jgi:VIT1/CCC1 family predicted Fe2+/Mn2+ transporter
VQSSQRGKEENPRAKFLEGGRWLRLVNGGIWIAAGMTSVILGIVFSSGAATPVLALMAATVLVSGIVRSIHQAVELTKLTVVLKDYEKQLCDETTAPEKREALESLATQLRGSIRQGRAKLVSSIALTLASVAGIVVTVLAVALTLTPLFFVGAGILLIAGIVTIALNRQAIQGAFKAIGSRLKKKTMASEPPSERPMPTKPSPMLQRFVESDPNETHEAMEALAGHRSCADLHNELNTSWEALAHEAEGKTPVSDLRGWRGQQELNQQTRQSLSSLARVHRPPSGNAEDVVRASREKSEQKQQEALMEKKAAEKTQRDEN